VAGVIVPRFVGIRFGFACAVLIAGGLRYFFTYTPLDRRVLA
jgi:hypothetical protein